MGLKVVVGSLATQGREGPYDETSVSACDKIASELHTGMGKTLSSELCQCPFLLLIFCSWGNTT